MTVGRGAKERRGRDQGSIITSRDGGGTQGVEGKLVILKRLERDS